MIFYNMENIRYRAVIHYLGLMGLTPKEIHEDMVITLGEEKKCAAEFKRDKKTLKDNPRLGAKAPWT